jgi:hypothetical protein
MSFFSSRPMGKWRLGFPENLVLQATLFVFVNSAMGQGQSKVPLPAGTEKQTVETICTACHTTERIVGSAFSSEQWKNVVERMIRNGAALPENKIDSVVAYLVGSFPPAPAGPVPRAQDGKPDLSGTWVAEAGVGGGRPMPLKLTAWGLDKYVWNRESSESKVLAAGVSQTGSGRSYEEAVEETFRPRRDQDPWFNCYPGGLVRLGPPVRMNGAGRGLQIIPTPGLVTIVYESRNAIRYIYTDGREHPENLELTWHGHSIGKWDGDTLVVDTIRLRDESWLDAVGHEHSTELHVVERFRRVDAATLEFERTLSDPKAFEGAFTDRVVLKLNPRYGWKQNLDDDCTQYMVRKPGFGEGLGGLLGVGEPPQ